jgi:2,3-dihydroxybenzoate decarboxylase
MREIMTGPLLSGGAWGYGIEVGTHILKLIYAGVFDHFPRLRVVVGHMGEALPFWLPRIDNQYSAQRSFFANDKSMKRMPSEYMKENIWITTSGMNFWPQLRMSLEVLGRERVLYATDYPFEDQGKSVQAVESMPLSADDKKVLFQDNAVRVFRL